LNVFSSQTEETFSFLVNQYGFTDPIATDGSWKTTFLYEKNDITIEIELNYKDMDCFVYLLVSENDKSSEQLIKKHLEEWINIERTVSKGNQTTIEQFEKAISRKSELLKNHLEDLLAELDKNIVVEKR
jgi:hypothetical protein